VPEIKIAIAGGGTGGHLFPALSIAAALEAEGVSAIEYYGTARGPEARLVPQYGYKFHKIWIKGYPRKLKPEVFLIPVKLTVSVFQCMAALVRFWPQCLLATGGYVCLPFMIAGKLLGLPIVVHEQNSLPGITTRIGAHWAKIIFYSFPRSADYFKDRNAVLSGNPVKKNLGSIDRNEALASLRLNPERKTIFIFGGSQGSATLNRAVSSVMGELNSEFNVIWQTGRGNLPPAIPSGVLAGEFFDDMNTLYSAADIAVCRAGAMTLAELAAVGLPAILVPFPYAAEDHQRLNAEPLKEAGAAVLILDRDFNGEVMLDRVNEMLSEPEKLSRMSGAMKSFHYPDSARKIAEAIIKIAERRE